MWQRRFLPARLRRFDRSKPNLHANGSQSALVPDPQGSIHPFFDADHPAGLQHLQGQGLVNARKRCQAQGACPRFSTLQQLSGQKDINFLHSSSKA